MERRYTVEGAANRLAVLGKVDQPPHRNTIIRWARDGRLAHTRGQGRGRGGPYLFSEEALQAFAPPNPGGRDGRPRKEKTSDV